jgi:hypothetical protein
MATSKKSKKCAALQFPANMKPDAMLAALKVEWVKRNIREDGSLNPNSYAPIWFYKGDTRGMASRGTGDAGGTLLVYSESGRIALPQKRTEWVG